MYAAVPDQSSEDAPTKEDSECWIEFYMNAWAPDYW